MGAARRWKQLLPFRSSPAPKPPRPRPSRVLDVLATPSTPPSKEEEVQAEFLCPILRLPMADPVILPSGTTYERACVRACADLGLALGPDGAVVAGDATVAAPVGIPNDALRAAIRKWCARSGRAPPVAPSGHEAREAVLRVAPVRSVSNLSCSTSRPSAASTSSSSSTSSAGSSAEMAAAAEVEADVVRVKDAVAAAEKEIQEVDPPVVSDVTHSTEEEEEEEAWARAVEKGTASEVEAAMAALRRATRESAARRRALCTPRVLAALLSPRHHHHRSSPAARADAAAALANLAIEPENRVPIVRAGAVPALVNVLASPSSGPEAREHAAGALFGLALQDGNRAAVGVLGALPPLLAVFSDRDDGDLPPRARRDAGMALYHLSLAAVNQSKLARGGGVRTLLALASDGDEPVVIRRLALMVSCNVAACAEGRDALMNAGAVAAATAILFNSDNTTNSDLQHWCVAALYGMSRDNARRFRGLARAAGADRPLLLVAERASPGSVQKEMAQTVLRVISGDDDGDVSDGEGGHGGRPQRRRAASWAGAPPAAAATPPSAHQWRSVCID